MSDKKTCACRVPNKRDCFLIRHPECNRYSDDGSGLYNEAIDEVCECQCHYEDEDEVPFWEQDL